MLMLQTHYLHAGFKYDFFVAKSSNSFFLFDHNHLTVIDIYSLLCGPSDELASVKRVEPIQTFPNEGFCTLPPG